MFSEAIDSYSPYGNSMKKVNYTNQFARSGSQGKAYDNSQSSSFEDDDPFRNINNSKP